MPQRILKRNLILVEDLSVGKSSETQDRGGQNIVGKQIELVFIFRTLNEIRLLDWSRFTRVAIDTGFGPLTEYVFDETNSSADNGDTILEPNPTIGVGRWIKVQYSYTTAELVDILDPVNTSVAKFAGAMVWNSTTGRPVWAAGSADADVWVDAAGSTLHTPV